jgi:hypothetical protein
MQMNNLSKMLTKASGFVFASLLLAAAPIQASTYSFQEITSNSPINVGSQLSVEVTSVVGGVQFMFQNSGPLASSIADIYFDNSGAFLGAPLTIVGNSAGVQFGLGAKPGDLPGGNAVGFTATTGFTADSDKPVQANGINPGEWLTLQTALGAGQSFATITQALDTGALRIGLHVQGLSDGQSESYISSPVPEPEIYAMLAAGLGLMGWTARRRKQQAA